MWNKNIKVYVHVSMLLQFHYNLNQSKQYNKQYNKHYNEVKVRLSRIGSPRLVHIRNTQITIGNHITHYTLHHACALNSVCIRILINNWCMRWLSTQSLDIIFFKYQCTVYKNASFISSVCRFKCIIVYLLTCNCS